LRIFKNLILRKISEQKGRKKQVSEENCVMIIFIIFILNQILIGWSDQRKLALMMDVCGILVGRPERDRLFWRLRRRWEDNINHHHKNVGDKTVNWINMT
jgi:hypothetical protein